MISVSLYILVKNIQHMIKYKKRGGGFMSVALHVRSSYTLLQSTLTISQIVECAKKHKYKAVALTDKQVLHGVMPFYHACKEADLKPIIGMEVDATEEEHLFGFILLAKNDDGYKNLMKLSTLLNTEQKKCISLEELMIYSKHCVVITNGDQNKMETMLLKEDWEAMEKFLNQCRSYFSDFYVSIARNDSPLLKQKNIQLKRLCQNIEIKTVALSRVYTADAQDDIIFKTLCAMKQGVSIEDKMLNYSPKRYFRSQEEMEQLYDSDDLMMTDVIADMCNVTMSFPKAQLPEFKNRYGVSSDEFLKSLCHKGLEKRMGFRNIPEVYRKRLSYELDIIIRMGFADYFLIVWDFIRFAKTQNIYIGPGRGSAAGSLVSYCLGITHADPIHYHLLFERFLNPERVSMPDIDTDFPDDRREEVIQYVYKLYGKHHVAHIITFNTLGAKQVLRDVGKAMMIPIRQIDSLCRLVPNRLKVTLQDAYDDEPRFKQMINSSEVLKKLFHISQRLEGLPRHSSLHAAGIILSRDQIEEVCPLIDVDEGISATQFTMEFMEELGLIKMDFLGLRNLTIIDEIVSQLHKNGHVIDIMKIPLNDKKTFELIQSVDTMGVFQLESEGMKNLIRKIQPKNFEDIVTTIALFRPGPMENIPEYLKRREHPETVDYIHPDFKGILENTYGIMIYQEQIMQIAQRMAGFSLGKADNLRKAISKKKGDQLQSFRKEFVEGAVKKGYEKNLAEHVYELIMKFANYGFNRSHSVAYGMIAYQMAYLKANAPQYFFRSLLNSVIGSEIKTSEYIFEARRRKIIVLPPSVNRSTSLYGIEQNCLRFPLQGIKGIGSAVSMQILKEREKRGEFKDFFDFTARMCGNKIGKKTIELLIWAGALDEFHMNRTSLLASLDDAIRYGDLVKIEDEDQMLFDFTIVSKPATISLKENHVWKLEKEKEALGFYLSAHPISMLRERINPNLKTFASLQRYRGYASFICVVERTRQHRTKRGDLMLFLTVADETMKFDLVCMPDIYAVHQKDLVKGNYLYVEGKIEREGSCLVKKITKIEKEENNNS